MNSNNGKTGLIVGIRNAAEHLGVSNYMVRRYISLGMPAGVVETNHGRFTYHFHVDNLEQFWRESTKKPIKTKSEIVEDENIEKIVKKKLVKKNRGSNSLNQIK